MPEDTASDVVLQPQRPELAETEGVKESRQLARQEESLRYLAEGMFRTVDHRPSHDDGYDRDTDRVAARVRAKLVDAATVSSWADTSTQERDEWRELVRTVLAEAGQE